jgi:hypothetical protein
MVAVVLITTAVKVWKVALVDLAGAVLVGRIARTNQAKL